MVALSQLDSSGSEQNFSGWPKDGSCAAIFFHRSQPLPGLSGGVETGCLVLAADGAALDAAAVGDEQQVVFGQVDVGLTAACSTVTELAICARPNVELDVHNLGVVVELHAKALQVLVIGRMMDSYWL